MFAEAAITNAGAALLEQFALGGTLTITKAAAGSNTSDQLAQSVTLKNEKATMDIVAKVRVEGGVQIHLRFKQQAQSYRVNQVGIWAKLEGGTSDGTPVLFAIYQDAEGVNIPSTSEMKDFKFEFYAPIAVSNQDDLTVTIDPQTYLTRDDIDEIEAEIQATSDGAKKAVEAAVAGMNKSLSDAQGSLTGQLQAAESELDTKLNKAQGDLNSTLKQAGTEIDSRLSQAQEKIEAAGQALTEASTAMDGKLSDADEKIKAGQAAVEKSIKDSEAKVDAKIAEVDKRLEGVATAGHKHDIGDVNELTETLAGKADAEHTHEMADVDGLDAALNAKLGKTEAAAKVAHALTAGSKKFDGSAAVTLEAADVGAAEAEHTHTASEVTDLATELGKKANTGHTHKHTDISDWTTELDKKANATHTHANGSESAAGFTKLYTATGTNTDGAMTQKATTDALALKPNHYTFAPTSGTPKWAIFAKSIRANNGNAGNATILVNGGGDLGGRITGSWVVNISTYDAKVTMNVAELMTPGVDRANNVKFGYYSDDSAHYFGMSSTHYRSFIGVTALQTGSVNIGNIADLDAQPTGWTEVTPQTFVPTTRKVNNKPLTTDITLTAADVGALATTGGKLTGNLQVGDNLHLFTDNEGGNIAIIPPTDKQTVAKRWEMDALGGALRIYAVDGTGANKTDLFVLTPTGFSQAKGLAFLKSGFTFTIPKTGSWTADNGLQKVTVNSLTGIAANNSTAYIADLADTAGDLAREGWARITKITAGTNSVTAWFTEKPEADIPVKLAAFELSGSAGAGVYIMRRGGIGGTKSIKGADVTLDTASYTYNGSAHAPKVTKVVLRGATLKENTDYVAVVTPATNAGNYNAQVFGVQEYTGVVQKPWTIAKATRTVQASASSVNVNGLAGTTAKVTLTYVGDGDVTVTGAKNVTATVDTDKKHITLTSKTEGTDTLTVTVAEGTNYLKCTCTITATVKFSQIWGVEWEPANGKTQWTRTDAAKNFTDPQPQLGSSGSGSSPFDECMPWKGMTEVDDPECGKCVKIPKFWYKLEAKGTGGLSIQISEGPQDGFSVSPAHMARGAGEPECDEILIGKYHCSENCKSTTGFRPRANETLETAWDGIHKLGDHVYMLDFHTRFTLWLLYLVEYADWNSQAKIGLGCSTGSTIGNNGSTDTLSYHTGATKGSDGYGYTKYRHIEGLWDNVWDWLGGAYYDNNGLNIIKDVANGKNMTGGVSVGMPYGKTVGDGEAYPAQFSVSSAVGFAMFYPKETGGSETAGSCDNWYFNVGKPRLRVGANSSKNLGQGLFYVYYADATDKDANTGSRLMKRVPAES